MKLAIIGGRSFSDYNLVKSTITQYFHQNITEIISGGAIGADRLGAKYAKENNIKLTEFIPNWDLYGKRAGFIRNEDIVKNSDTVLAFWDSESKGTANSLSTAKRLKKTTIIIYY